MKRFLSLMVSLALLISVTSVLATGYMVPSASEWGDVWGTTNGTGSAVDNADGSTTVTITDSNTGKRMTTLQKYKLDGLYISLTEVSTDSSMVPMMITPNAGGWVDGSGMLFIAGASYVFYKQNSETTLRSVNTGWTNFIANNPRNSLFMYFYKQADGSFKYQLNGGTFDITAAEVEAMFGSADPEVYFSIGSSWYQDGKTTSMKVKELSSNSNRLMSYYDLYNRDSFVSAAGDMSGMTVEHYNGEGAYNALARAVKLDGLDFKYSNVSAAQAPGSLWFKYSTAQDGCYNTTSAAGLLYYIDEAGRVERYVDYVGFVEKACFFNGTSYGRPSEITVSARRNAATGDLVVTFTGNYTAGTNVITDTIESSVVAAKFGTDNPEMYLNFTSGNTQTINIDYITNSTDGVSFNKSLTSIYVGETETLEATVTPANARNKAVTWLSSNEDVATVTDGVVTAVATGTATITATTHEGGFVVSCEVTVNMKPINYSSYSISVDSLITKVQPGTTETVFKNSLEPAPETEIIFTNVINGVVGTGTKMDVTIGTETKQYTIVIFGDITGDGDIGIADLISVRNHLLGEADLIDEFLAAGDVSADGNVTVCDLLVLKDSIINNTPISQDR